MTLYQGKYHPKHPEKYTDPKGLDDICFRSSWERAVCIFCDNNPAIIRWGSEVIVINYINELDQKMHRYFVDFYIEMESGKKLLVEIKPAVQTQPPVKTKGKRATRYLLECNTYVTNMSKWSAAKSYADRHGMIFQIWTEHQLEQLGIPLVTSKKFRYINYSKKRTNNGRLLQR